MKRNIYLSRFSCNFTSFNQQVRERENTHKAISKSAMIVVLNLIAVKLELI